MLNPAEKAYLHALQSLKRREYAQATHYFNQAAPFFAENQEFILLRETTTLLVAVKEELRELDGGINDERIEIEEFFDHLRNSSPCLLLRPLPCMTSQFIEFRGFPAPADIPLN